MNDIISNEEMANYMNMVLNSDAIKEAYLTCDTSGAINSLFQNIGNILAKYYISTGDSSLESASQIIRNYVSINNQETFFKTFLMSKIEKQIAGTLNMGENYSKKKLLKQKKILSMRLKYIKRPLKK